MASIIEQFSLNGSYFVLVGLFVAVYVILTRTFFIPFQKLLDVRHKKTVEDRELAEKLARDAENKLKEYQDKIHTARMDAKRELDALITAAKAKETELFTKAREEAKKITQDALAHVQQEKQALQAQLQKEVEPFAWQVTERLTGHKSGQKMGTP